MAESQRVNMSRWLEPCRSLESDSIGKILDIERIIGI